MCLVGANTGCKTSLVHPHVYDPTSDYYIRTLGTKVSIKRLLLKHAPGARPIGMDMLLWDLHSRPALRKVLIETYLRGTAGILAVADMTRRETLEEAGDWIREVEDVAGEIPVVVIGANRERVDRREVSEDEVRHLADAYGAACFFASANSGEPVEAAFAALAERIVGRKLRDATAAR